MDVDDLRRFLALARTGQMTEAAELLAMPQSTLSRALARLEQEAGAALFDRVGRAIRLNPAGRAFVEHAERAVGEVDAGLRRVRRIVDPDEGVVRLAFLHSTAGSYVPALLRDFRALAPEMRFELSEGAGHELVALLQAGEADLAISGPRPRGDLDWTVLYVEQLCLVVPAGHRLAERRRVALRDAADEPFVLLREGFGMRQLTDALFAAAGIHPRIAFEAIEIPSAEGLVAAGLGVSVVPLPRADRQQPGVAYVPLGDAAARREIGLVRRVGDAESAAVRRFADFVLGRSSLA